MTDGWRPSLIDSNCYFKDVGPVGLFQESSPYRDGYGLTFTIASVDVRGDTAIRRIADDIAKFICERLEQEQMVKSGGEGTEQEE